MENNLINGLSETEVQYRLKEYGLNKINVQKKNTAIKILLSQFTSLIIIILFICSFVFLFIGETLEFFLILVIILINGIIGFIQEYKADKAVESLKKMLVLKAEVLRDGQRKEINSEYLVPEDIVYVYEGDKLPADLKIIENYSLLIDESILTGESNPVRKDTKDNNNLFSGTTVVSGKGKAVVINTGMKTEFGKIVNLVSEDKQEKTNLEKDIDYLSKILIYIMIASFVILFILGIVRGEQIITIFLISVSLAISAIPEGLPIVMTLT
jgi:Ca2+-transporting ATPase